MSYQSNYPPPGGYPGGYPPNSGPPPPPQQYGGGYGYHGAGHSGGGGYGSQGYGGQVYGGQSYGGGGGYQGYQHSAYGGAQYGNPAAVPGFTAPPTQMYQQNMPLSIRYGIAASGMDPMGASGAMMQQNFCQRHPENQLVRDYELARQQLHHQMQQNQQMPVQFQPGPLSPMVDQQDETMKACLKKINDLENQLLSKGAEECSADSDMKNKLRDDFISELMRRQTICGTFEECSGTIVPCVVYGENDIVREYFKNKGHELEKKKKWDAECDAECIRESIRGWGTDEEKIKAITVTRSNEQRQKIYKKYKTMYGRDLEDDFTGDLSGNFKDTILALYKSPAYFDAYSARKAIYGLGTDEESLIEVLLTRTNGQINEMKEEYNEITYEQSKSSKSLETDIEGDTSGDFKRLLISASTGGRNTIDREKLEEAVEDLEGPNGWTGMFKVNYEKLCNMKSCERDAKELFEAGEEKWGTDEETFNRIFSTKDFYTLRTIYAEYVKCSQRDIINSVNRETSGDLRRGLRAIAQSVKCRPMFFAERLKKSMKGLGTDDTTLIRIVVSRSEIDLVQIKKCFLELTGQTLYKYIQDDTSGDYKQLLMAIVGKN